MSNLAHGIFAEGNVKLWLNKVPIPNELLAVFSYMLTDAPKAKDGYLRNGLISIVL